MKWFKKSSKGGSAGGVRELAQLPPPSDNSNQGSMTQEASQVPNDDLIGRQFVINDVHFNGEDWLVIDTREEFEENQRKTKNKTSANQPAKNTKTNHAMQPSGSRPSAAIITPAMLETSLEQSLSVMRAALMDPDQPTCSKYTFDPVFVSESIRDDTTVNYDSIYVSSVRSRRQDYNNMEVNFGEPVIEKKLFYPPIAMGHPCPKSKRACEEVADQSIGNVSPQKYFGLSEQEGVIIHFNVVEHRPAHVARRFTNGIDYPGKIKPLMVFGREVNEDDICFLKKLSRCLCERFKTLMLWARKLCAPPRIQALRGNRSQPGKPTTPDDAIRAYALHLAADKTTIFAQNVENFISCTKESKETCPHVVMRNIRQFMSGMKNYLVKHGEREFEKEVEKARLMLKSNEFLNLDAILEDVLYSAVVTPLRSHVYSLLADKYVKSGDIAQLDAGMRICRALPPLRVGIKPYTRVPKDDELCVISNLFLKMQEAESPSQKMEYLLAAISGIFQTMKSDQSDPAGQLGNIGADDFLPYLVCCLARCSMPGAELEAELMAGLLPPRMLSGEGGYYLTTLFGAVAILKQLAPKDDVKKPEWQTTSIGSCLTATPATTPCNTAGVAKVLVPDECSGALRCLSFPWRAGAKARDICRVLAHGARITDSQDYGLFVLRDGEEILINDTDCPQDIIEQNKCNCMFAYKRIDAKIAWPKQALTSYP